jgi:hypothetical protein
MRLLPVSLTCLILALQWFGTGQSACAETFRIRPSSQQAANIKEAMVESGIYRYHCTDAQSKDLNVGISLQIPRAPDQQQHELESISWKLGNQSIEDLKILPAAKGLTSFGRSICSNCRQRGP